MVHLEAGKSDLAARKRDMSHNTLEILRRRGNTRALFPNGKVITSSWINGRLCTCEQARAQRYNIFTEVMEVYERFGHVVNALRVIIASPGGVESLFLADFQTIARKRNEKVIVITSCVVVIHWDI